MNIVNPSPQPEYTTPNSFIYFIETPKNGQSQAPPQLSSQTSQQAVFRKIIMKSPNNSLTGYYKATPSPDVVPTKAQQWLNETFKENTLVDKVYLKYCKTWWFNICLILSIACCIVELVMIAYHSLMDTFGAQVGIFTLSTILFLVIHIKVLFGIRKRYRYNTLQIQSHFQIWMKILYESILPESIIEFMFIVIGWSLMFNRETVAISIFRNIRIFRYVYYSKYYISDKKSGLVRFYVIFYGHIISQYLYKIYEEVFTTLTKGSLAIIAIFFYIAFIYGLVFWQQTRTWALPSPDGGPSGSASQCHNLLDCFFVMIQLTFYDGNSFDFIKSLFLTDHGYLVFLLVIYLCLTAFVLINGILGIFAGSFSTFIVEQFAESSMGTIKASPMPLPTEILAATSSGVPQETVTEAVETGAGIGVGSESSFVKIDSHKFKELCDRMERIETLLKKE